MKIPAAAIIEIRRRLEAGTTWHDLLLGSLTPQQKRVFDRMDGQTITTTDVAQWENCSLNHANNILSGLHRAGAVSRVLRKEGRISRFIYQKVAL